MDAFRGTVITADVRDDCFILIIRIEKPAIDQLTGAEAKDKKAVAQFEAKLKAAEEFMKDIGLGPVEIEYI